MKVDAILNAASFQEAKELTEAESKVREGYLIIEVIPRMAVARE